MLNSLEGQPLPHIIDWLVDELGEIIVARALGAHYEGLRAGGMDWDSLDAEVMQSLSGLVNGALAAGAVMPAPPEPEPDAGLQTAVESPADGRGPEDEDEPEQRSAETTAPATITEQLPEMSLQEMLSGPRGHRANEIVALSNLHRRLWHQVKLRKKGGPGRQSFIIATCKIEHLMITGYNVSFDSYLVADKPSEFREAILCYSIHNLERKMQAGKAGGSRFTRILWALGFIGDMPVDEAIKLAIKKRGLLPDLQIAGSLLSDLLRQGREGCIHYRYIHRRRR